MNRLQSYSLVQLRMRCIYATVQERDFVYGEREWSAYMLQPRQRICGYGRKGYKFTFRLVLHLLWLGFTIPLDLDLALSALRFGRVAAVSIYFGWQGV
jgi:hypothetical protein